MTAAEKAAAALALAAAAEGEMRVLDADECLEIVETNIVRTYKSEEENYKGKTYRLYAFGKKAFAVHQDSKFHKDIVDGNVHHAKIEITDDGWSLNTYVPWSKVNGLKTNRAKNDAITPEMFKVKLQSEAAYAELS